MKKVLFFIESLQCGGAEKSLLTLLNNLDYSNYEISLMVLKTGGEFENLLPSNIKKITVKYKLRFYERLKFKIFKVLDFRKKNHPAQLFWKSTKNNISVLGLNFDVAIAWGQGFSTYYVSEKVNANKKYAWVNTDYFKAGYNWKQDLDIYQNYNKVIGISEFVKETMQKFLNKSQVIKIDNIIDSKEINIRSKAELSLPFKSNQINIVSVGRLVNHKAFNLAIGACAILINQGINVHLFIIGEGIQRAYLENEIRRLKIGQNCSLLGYQENPYPYIKACDIYLQTSKVEGLGRTIIEASLLNKPIITTNFPTAYTILTNEVTGLITNMNSEDIALTIKRLLSDSNLKENLVKNLIKKENKDKDKTLTSVYELFNS
tara:strand:- start:5703 stop:6827 length:1125 start_codon:yes stop_codon:yes gene_type:complete